MSARADGRVCQVVSGVNDVATDEHIIERGGYLSRQSGIEAGHSQTGLNVYEKRRQNVFAGDEYITACRNSSRLSSQEPLRDTGCGCSMSALWPGHWPLQLTWTTACPYRFLPWAFWASSAIA